MADDLGPPDVLDLEAPDRTPTRDWGPGLDDDELLTALSAERRQSAGFEEDSVLLADRIQALQYVKGEMPDMPSLDNRSKAVSMDAADAVETALPDLIEIFTTGDDVLSFLPNGPDDEKAAEQETDYVKKVIFQDNPGFEILYEMIKDALQVKTGVAMAWWEKRDPEVEEFEGKTAEELTAASLSSQISSLSPDETEEGQPPTFSFTATKKRAGRLRIRTIPPEDFTVARDTHHLPESTYCAFRARPRAIELLEQGVERDIVDSLPMYGSSTDEQTELARDTAGEHADQRSVQGNHDLRQVEVITHFIRINADGEGPKLWQVTTSGAETILIDKKEVPRISIAAITPFPVGHRFYGESLVDKVLELQRQRTALKRILLDSGYFALNQRMEVALDKASQWTVADLMRNEPMMPVRSKTGDAVRPITAGPLNFNVLEALEFSAVEVEQRTGIVRNAQGLAPDTLHTTAHGMLALLNASQKRLRLIARVFAETGIRDLYLMVHAILREHADQPEIVKLRGGWVPIDPTSWGERTEMAIEIGNGSSGREQEVAILTSIGGLQEKIVQAQGGMSGPLVTPQNIYALTSKIAEKSGEKTPGAFFTDPGTAPQPGQGAPPPPHPEAIKAQAQAQSQQQQLAAQAAQADKDRQAQAEQHAAQMQQQAATDGAKLALTKEQQDFNQQLEARRLAAEEAERQGRLALDAQKAERDHQYRMAQLAQAGEIAKLQAAQKIHDTQLRTASGLEQTRTAGEASFTTATTVQAMKMADNDQQRQADLAIQASEQRDSAELSDAKGEDDD